MEIFYRCFCDMDVGLVTCYFHENETDFAEEVIKLFFQLILESKITKGLRFAIVACRMLLEYVDPIITTFLNILSDVTNAAV